MSTLTQSDIDSAKRWAAAHKWKPVTSPQVPGSLYVYAPLIHSCVGIAENETQMWEMLAKALKDMRAEVAEVA
jgi:hypothetical protein